MKTPIFEIYPGAWQDILLPPVKTFRKLNKVDLYTLTLMSGNVLRYCSGDVNFGYNGLVWDSHGVRVGDQQNPPTAHWKTGMDVDNWQVMMFPRNNDPVTGDQLAFPDRIGDIPWIAAVLGGALDGADVKIDRAYLLDYPQPPQFVVEPTVVFRLFGGEMAAVDLYRGGAAMTINSYIEKFTQNMPKNIFQAGCRHVLFDPGCTLLKDNFQQSGVVAAGSTQGSIYDPSLNPFGNSGLSFVLGRIKMTSGANAGYQRAIRAWSNGTMTLLAPFYFPIVTGDTFNAWPGCSKTQGMCASFNNTINFGGQPYIPAPETAI